MSVAVSEACSKVCPQRAFYSAIVILAGQEVDQVAPLGGTTMPLLSKHQLYYFVALRSDERGVDF